MKDGADNGLFSMIYYFNFGQPHDKKCKGQDAAVTEVLEVLKQSTDTCEILGRVDSRTVGLLDPNDPRKGIYVQYGDGDRCTSGDNPMLIGKPRQTRFNIHCAPKQDDFRVDLPGGTQGTTKCLLEFTINSPAGCPGGVYGGWRSSVILFWILFIFGTYIVVGMVYNMRKKNLSGKEAIPNIEFWREFPMYVKDGFCFTFGFARSGVDMISSKIKGNAPPNYTDI